MIYPFKNSPHMLLWTMLHAQILKWLGRDRQKCLAPFLGRAGFFSAANSLADPTQDESSISFWAADAVMEPENDLPELILARTRFMTRVQSCMNRQSKWTLLVSRAKSLNTDQVFDHFSAVTGHSVKDISACAAHQVEVRRPSVVSESAFASLGLAAFKTVTRSNLQKAGSRAVATAVSAYLVLIMVGPWTPRVDPAKIIHGLPEYSWLELGATPRGRYIPREYYMTRRFKVALSKLQKANTSILGYIPGFKQDLLNEGILELEDAIAFQRMGGYVYPQAIILLADAYLRAGQVEKAVPLIEHVIMLDERKASEARAMRAKLRRQGLYILAR